jgi:hypothetical protein
MKKKNADPDSREVCGEGLQLLACWDCWIESRRVALISVCCQVEASATG